jgi:transposase
MQELIYVGLDLGSSHCCQSIINANGSLKFSRFIPTSEQHLREAFTGLNGEVRVHMEAGELADWVHSVIGPLVSRVVVSHPRSLAWIGKDSVKDDKIDAGKLAELLRLGRVHEVYCEQDDKRRTFKHLVTHHEQMSREQARRKSKIKARLRTLGVIRKDARLFTGNGQVDLLDAIESVEIKAMIAQSFAVLNRMLECEREAKAAMLEFSRRFPEVRLLQSAPGVGAITACRFVGYIQTPLRFSNKRKLWRYCRLGITRRESNGKRLSHPRLDNAGVGSLKDVSRKVFEAALRCKGDNSFKRCYEQSLDNTKNTVHARLATQRKILGCLRAMWLSNQPYRDFGSLKR